MSVAPDIVDDELEESGLDQSGEREIVHGDRPSGVVCRAPVPTSRLMRRSELPVPANDTTPVAIPRLKASPRFSTPTLGEAPPPIAIHVRVGALMSRVTCVRADLPVALLASLLEDAEVVVVDAFGVPLGLVQLGPAARELGDRVCAGEVMTPVATVAESDRLAKAVALMARDGVRRACVVSSEQTVVGMFDREHAARWIVESDVALSMLA